MCGYIVGEQFVHSVSSQPLAHYSNRRFCLSYQRSANERTDLIRSRWRFVNRVAPVESSHEMRRRVASMAEVVTEEHPNDLQVPQTPRRRRPSSPQRDGREGPLEPFRSLSKQDTSTVGRLSCSYSQVSYARRIDEITSLQI